MGRKRIIYNIITVLLCLTVLAVHAAADQAPAAEPQAGQDASGEPSKNTAIAYCVDTEQVLYEKDGVKGKWCVIIDCPK